MDSPAGSSGSVQYNASGAFGGAAQLNYDSTSNRLNFTLKDARLWQQNPPSANGWNFAFVENTGGINTNGPSGQPNYYNDVMAWGWNCSDTVGVPLDPSKHAVWMIMESKWYDGVNFGAEVHLETRDTTGTYHRPMTFSRQLRFLAWQHCETRPPAPLGRLVNWFETEYPSPLFPTPGSDGRPRVGSTQYFAAWGAAMRSYPLLRGGTAPGRRDPPEVLELMHRVTLIPVVRRTLFGPRVTIFTKDGRRVTKEGTGREFIWDSRKRRAASGPSARAPASAMRNLPS
jgi:hypothetical protein